MGHPLDTCKCGHPRGTHWNPARGRFACGWKPKTETPGFVTMCGCSKFVRVVDDGPGDLKALLSF